MYFSADTFFILKNHGSIKGAILENAKDGEHSPPFVRFLSDYDCAASYSPPSHSAKAPLKTPASCSGLLYFMIYSMDQTVGQLMDTLREEGLEEDTIIVFTSDNGGLATAEGSPTCNYPLSEGKGWMYEGAVREPLAVVWPGHILPGTLSHELTTSPDFYPTLLELAGLPLQPQQHVDGISLAPLLLGKNDSLDREAIFWHYPHYGNQGGTPGSSLRSGKWKYIEFYEDNSRHLFDLETDIAEKHDVASIHPELVERFHQLLSEWLSDCKAYFPTVNADYGAD